MKKNKNLISMRENASYSPLQIPEGVLSLNRPGFFFHPEPLYLEVKRVTCSRLEMCN